MSSCARILVVKDERSGPTGGSSGGGDDAAAPPSCRPPPPDGAGSSTMVEVDDDDEEEELNDWLPSEGESELSDAELDRLLASPHEGGRVASPVGSPIASPVASPIDSPVASPKPNPEHAAELIEESPAPVRSGGSSGTAPAPHSPEMPPLEPESDIMEIEDSPLKTPAKLPPTQRSGSTNSLESGEDSQVEKAVETPPPRPKKQAAFQECTCGKPVDECKCFDTRHVKKQIASLKMQLAARTLACEPCPRDTRTHTYMHMQTCGI